MVAAPRAGAVVSLAAGVEAIEEEGWGLAIESEIDRWRLGLGSL
jgi:hypothetical protein